MIPTLGAIIIVSGDHAMGHGAEYGPRNVKGPTGGILNR